MKKKPKRIKIAFFNDSFLPMQDGVLQVMTNYATRMSKWADVTVFVPESVRHPEYVDDFPFRVVRVKANKIWFMDYDFAKPKKDKAFQEILKNETFDIIHTHSPFPMGKAALKYGKMKNIPVIATMHTQFKKDIKRHAKLGILTYFIMKTMMRVFNGCTECFAVNPGVSQLYYKEYKAKRLPGVMYNATDMLPIENREESNKLINEQFNLSETDTVLLFVGRITLLKNILFIVDSLKFLKDKGIPFKMMFVGDGKDMPKLKKHVAKKGLEDYVIYTGKIGDRELLAKIYARAKLFLFPSSYDTNGLVQIEAASQSTPTVYLKDTLASSNAEDEVCGFIANNCPRAYADKIIKALTNEELYNKVRQGAFERIYHYWDTVVEDTYNTYLEIIDQYNNKNS